MTVHLRQKGGGPATKSHSQLYNYCTHHDIMTLHLCLLIGQFVVLHFETSGGQETKGEVICVINMHQS